MLTLLNESLWGDEAFSALAVMKSFGEMMGVVMRDTSPPGFYVLGWLWVRIFGFSEVALRSLSLLLISGAAVFGGLIVYKLSKNRVVSLLTFLICFLNPFSFRYAFEWRMYALLAFATLGSIYFFVSRKWGWYIVLTVLALYTHHFSLFTVAVQGLWFSITEFIHMPKFNKEHLVIILKHLWPFWLIILAYLPWVYPMYLQIIRVQGAGFWLKVPTGGEAANLMLMFVTGGVSNNWRLGIGCLVIVIIFFKKWRKYWGKFLEILLLVVSPVVLSFIVSHLVTPIFYDRYLLSVVIGMGVLVGLGSKKWAVPGLVVLVFVYGYFSYQEFTHPIKRPFKELALYVKSEIKEGDFLLNYNGGAHHLWETKYYGIPGPIYVPKGELPLYVGTAQMMDKDIVKNIPQEVNRVVVVTSEAYENVVLEKPWIKGDYREFGELKVIFFERFDFCL